MELNEFLELDILGLGIKIYWLVILFLLYRAFILANGGFEEIKDKFLRWVNGLIKGSADPESVKRSLSRLKITPYQIKSERTVENLVVEHLKKGFKRVHSQYSVGGNLGLKVDVDINESVGIEIKLAKQIESSTANMMRLFGQAVYYSRRKYGKENMLVLIVGNEKYKNSERFKELFKYLEAEEISYYYLKTK